MPTPRNEYFPDAGRAEQSQGMKPSVPLVEIANDADALGIGSPDGEARAGHLVNYAQLRAEFFVNTAFIALARTNTNPIRPASAEMKTRRGCGGSGLDDW